MAAVLLISTDLLFSSRIGGAAQLRQIELITAASTSAAHAHRAERRFDLVIVDLTLSTLDLVELLRGLRQSPHPPGTVLAYGPHVHAGRLEAAVQAGCDRVLTRGQFSAQLEEILSGLEKEGS